MFFRYKHLNIYYNRFILIYLLLLCTVNILKTKNKKQHLNKKKNLPTNHEQPKDLKKKRISKKLKHVDKKKEEGELIKKNKKRLIRWGEKEKKWG